MVKPTESGRDAAELVDTAARAWAEEQERTMTEHPDPDELVDYQEGRLDARATERVRRHVLSCGLCRQELLDLHGFDREVPEDSPLLPSDEMTERSWRRFQAARTAARSGKRSDVDAPGDSRSSRTIWLIAASVLLVLAAAVLGGALLGRDEPAPFAVAGSPFVFDLDPAGKTVLRAAATAEILVPPEVDSLVPRLNLGDLTAHQGYSVEVLGRGDRTVLHREGLSRDHSGRVSFMASRAEWPAGEYRVLLLARDGGEHRKLATYALRLRYEP